MKKAIKNSFYDFQGLLRLILCLSFLFALSACGGDVKVDESIPDTAILTWNAPTTNADGTALTDLAGYKVHYGTASGNYTFSTIDAGNLTTYTVSNLSSGTYYFAVTAYDTPGNESSYSNEVSKIIQ